MKEWKINEQKIGILMKEKMVEKIVRDNTDHIIAQLHSGDHSKCLTPD